MTDTELEAFRQAWAAVTSQSDPPSITLTGDGSLPAQLAVLPGAVATIATALGCASPTGSVALDRDHIGAAMRSERFFRVDDAPAGAGFAALSRFWPTADGWVRTHANYRWHRAALLDALGVEDPDDVAAAMAGRRAEDIETAVYAAGGIAVAVRDAQAWSNSAVGRAVEAEPLVSHGRIGEARPRTSTGLRVLDLTRVIAGPVCTRVLGALGADVLRLDPPSHPDVEPGAFADTLLAKRTAALDARTREGLERLHDLLDRADVLVCGYRPGSLDRFGLTDEELTERHPGLVVIRLSAWGHSGPWAERRGFDSVVQAGTGVALLESDGGTPGALPCQFLDHGTGYLAAAAVLDGVRRQRAEGGTFVRRLSLARTARWLQDLPSDDASAGTSESATWTARLYSGDHTIEAVRPPGEIDGRALTWPATVSGYLQDPAEW